MGRDPILPTSDEARRGLTCVTCGQRTSLEDPLREGLCATCYRAELRRNVARFRNLLAAAIGLSVGLDFALLGDVSGVSPRGLRPEVLVALAILSWPLSFIGIFGVARLLDRLFGIRR